MNTICEIGPFDFPKYQLFPQIPENVNTISPPTFQVIRGESKLADHISASLKPGLGHSEIVTEGLFVEMQLETAQSKKKQLHPMVGNIEIVELCKCSKDEML